VYDLNDKYLVKEDVDEHVALSNWPQLSRKRKGGDGWFRKWYNAAQLQVTKLDQPGKSSKVLDFNGQVTGIWRYYASWFTRSKAAKGVQTGLRRPSLESYLGTQEERAEIRSSHNTEMPTFPPYVLNPRSFSRLCWDLTITACIGLTTFNVSFRMAFEMTMFKQRVANGEKGWAYFDTDLMYFEYAMDFLFFVNFLMQARTAYFRKQRLTNDYEIVTEPSKILTHWMRTWFIFDFVCGMPWEGIMNLYFFIAWDGMNPSEVYANENLAPPSWSRVPRMLMVVKVPMFLKNTRVSGMDKYVANLREQAALHSGLVRIIKFLGIFYISMHLIACVLFYCGSDHELFLVNRVQNTEPSVYSAMSDEELRQGKSWITEVKIVIATCEALADGTESCTSGRSTVLEAPISRQYLMSLYWVATTMTQCGYGDLTPYTQYEVASLLFGMVIGASMFSYIVGNASQLIDELQGRSALVNEELDSISRFMVEAGISKDLRSKCLLFFEKHLMSPMLLMPPVTEGLPQELISEIKLRIFKRALYRPDSEKPGVFRFNPLLEGLRRETLAKLLFKMKIQETVPLEVLWVEGDPPPGIVIVWSGTLEVVDSEGAVVTTLFPGNFVGENLLVPGEECSPFTVRTKGWCDILMLSAEVIAEALNASEEDAYWMACVSQARWSRFLACFRASKSLKSVIVADKGAFENKLTSEAVLRAVTHKDIGDPSREAEVQAGTATDMTKDEQRRHHWKQALTNGGLHLGESNGEKLLGVASKRFEQGWAVDWSHDFVDDDVAVNNEAQARHEAAYPKARLTVFVKAANDIKSTRVRLIESFNPFCRIVVNGRAFETACQPDQISPSWQETHVFKFDSNLAHDTPMQAYVLDRTGTGTALVGMTEGLINVNAPGKWQQFFLPLYDESHNLCGNLSLKYQFEPVNTVADPVVKATAADLLRDLLSFDPGAKAKARLMEVLTRVNGRLSEIERKCDLDRAEVSRLIAENVMALDSIHTLGVGDSLRAKLLDVARLIPAWQSPEPGHFSKSISRDLSESVKAKLLFSAIPVLANAGSPTHGQSSSIDPSADPSLWKVFTSRSTGKPFWFNKFTKETRWTDPALDVTAALASSSHSTDESQQTPEKPTTQHGGGTFALVDIPPGWVQRLSQRKNLVYFQNIATGATSWSAPCVSTTPGVKPTFAAPTTPRPHGKGGKGYSAAAAGKAANGKQSVRGKEGRGGFSVRTIPSRVPCRPEGEVSEVEGGQVTLTPGLAGKAGEAAARVRLSQSHPTVSGEVRRYIKKDMGDGGNMQFVPHLSGGTPASRDEVVGWFRYRVGDARVEYVGRMSAWRRHGYGILKLQDGVTYCGEWEDDEPHGYGIEVYTDGGVYKGQFQRDKRHGFGALVCGDVSYCGGWADGMRHGSGIEVFLTSGEAVECLVYVERGEVTLRSKICEANQTEYEMLQDMASRMMAKVDSAAAHAQKTIDDIDALEEEFDELFPPAGKNQEEDEQYKAHPYQHKHL